MRSELERIERIEKYVLGYLEGEELLQFEDELESSPGLREEVELQRLIMKGVENAGLRKSLDHIHYSGYDPIFSYFLKSWGKYIVDGVLIVIIVALLFLNKENKGEDPETRDKTLETTSLNSVVEDSLFEKDEKVFETPRFILEQQSVFFEHANPLDNFFPSDNTSKYFFINPEKDTIITGVKGTRVNIPSGSFVYENGIPVSGAFTFYMKEIYKKSEIIMNDLTNKTSENIESAGGIYLDADQKNKQLRVAKGKNLEVNFFNNYVPHVDNPHSGPAAETTKEEELVYYKVFEQDPERRLIILPAVVLDYDIIYTRKSADPLMNERIESLLLSEYENTFTSTTQFHYRIEGCQLYGRGTELLDIYLNHKNLKLWEADSLVLEYLNSKAKDDCKNFAKYMKAAEYFRWLKSLRHGKVERISELDYRNYRKGQIYNKLPDKVLEKYLKESGLTKNESDELIDYFKKMYYFQKMFYRKTKYSSLDIEKASLDYYYENEGKFIGFVKNNCSGKVSLENKNKYIYKAGNGLGSATELNYFMPVNKLGWINSERFINYKNTVSLKVLLSGIDTSHYTKVYIVFKDAVLGGQWTKERSNYFDRIPEGANIFLVGLSYNNNSLYYGRREVVAGAHSEEVLEMNLSEEAAIRKDLLQLDQ